MEDICKNPEYIQVFASCYFYKNKETAKKETGCNTVEKLIEKLKLAEGETFEDKLKNVKETHSNAPKPFTMFGIGGKRNRKNRKTKGYKKSKKSRKTKRRTRKH